VERRIRELQMVKRQVDAFQSSQEHLTAQLDWIEKARSAQRCPGRLLADLDPTRVAGTRIEELELEGESLVLAGSTDSREGVERLASALRGKKWAKQVRAGAAATAPSPGKPRRFGLFATVEVPPCPPPQPPDEGKPGAESR
jgi:Tfp pilus assembly protein PilN